MSETASHPRPLGLLPAAPAPCTACGEPGGVHTKDAHLWCNDCAQWALDAPTGWRFCGLPDCWAHAETKVCHRCLGTGQEGGEPCPESCESGLLGLDDANDRAWCRHHGATCLDCGGQGRHDPFDHEDSRTTCVTVCENCDGGRVYRRTK